MAKRTYRIGSLGPFIYDDANFDAFNTEGIIKTTHAPVANGEVLRYEDAPLSDETGVETGHVLVYNAGSGKWESGFIYSKHSKEFLIAEAESQGIVRAVFGFIHEVVTGETTSSGSPSGNIPVGVAKLLIVINAGSDTDGTITINGTSVDPDTGSETGSDTEDITISGVTTDSSTTDANSQTVYDFTNAYISSKLWTGNVTVSTTDVNLSDFDAYAISYEDFDENVDVFVEALEFNIRSNNASAWFSARLYELSFTVGKVASFQVLDDGASNTAEIVRQASAINADEHYKLRRGNLNAVIDGTLGGVILEVFLGPLASAFWESVNGKIVYRRRI